jgi:uncharacterized protein (TIGR00730 family)
MRVCVFAASSSRIDRIYSVEARKLGVLLAEAGLEVLYGGGGIGLMGILAEAVLQTGGNITGVIPEFMKKEGWCHGGLTRTVITRDMGERKKWLFENSDAVVALPGGIGTLEELTEAITLKQLGLYNGPVIILNTNDYYKSFIRFLEQMIEGNFLRIEHSEIWEVVYAPEEVDF